MMDWYYRCDPVPYYTTVRFPPFGHLEFNTDNYLGQKFAPRRNRTVVVFIRHGHGGTVRPVRARTRTR